MLLKGERKEKSSLFFDLQEYDRILFFPFLFINFRNRFPFLVHNDRKWFWMYKYDMKKELILIWSLGKIYCQKKNIIRLKLYPYWISYDVIKNIRDLQESNNSLFCFKSDNKLISSWIPDFTYLNLVSTILNSLWLPYRVGQISIPDQDESNTVTFY